VLEVRHTFLHYLKSFRFLAMEHDDDTPLYQAVGQFVGQRKQLIGLTWEGVRGSSWRWCYQNWTGWEW
jgi:hypothetical protein